VNKERTELSVRLDAGDVRIQAQTRDVIRVARIRFPEGTESGRRIPASARCDTATPLG
jgi:hypothetical protein